MFNLFALDQTAQTWFPTWLLTYTYGGVVGPALDFTASVGYGYAPLTVTFTPTSPPLIASYYWDFGDGFVSSDVIPTHIYSNEGSYTVILVGTYTDLSTETITKINYINVLTTSKLPENKCCYGPFEVVCIGSTSTDGDYFVDSSLSYKICKNADCYTTCEGEYGTDYNVINDYSGGCPTCRECYLEHKSTMGRYYSIISTTCNILVTDYFPDNTCGSCLQEAETYCFAFNKYLYTDPPECFSIFQIDNLIFVVKGEGADCGIESNCGSCWQTPNVTIDENFAFLPEELDTCDTTTTSTTTTTEETSTVTSTALVDIVWHNKPSENEGLGTTYNTEIEISAAIGTSLDRRSCQHSDMTLMPCGQTMVAYEERSQEGVTKISLSEQLTSVDSVITHWRSLGFGQLIQSSFYEDYVRFRIFDDFYTGENLGDNCTIDLSSSSYSVGFRTGPLAGKMYQLDSLTRHPCANDIVVDNGNLSSLYFDSTTHTIYGIEYTSGGNIFVCIPETDSTSTNIGTYANLTNLFVDSTNSNIIILARTIPGAYGIYYKSLSPTVLVWNTTVLFTGPNDDCFALTMNVDTQEIYFAVENQIRKVHITAGVDVLVASTTETMIPAISIYDNHVYWTEYNNKQIIRSDLNGGNVTTILTTNGNPWGLDVKSGKIYWSEMDKQTIKYCNIDGSNIRQIVSLASTSTHPATIAADVDTQKLYFIDGDILIAKPWMLENTSLKQIAITPTMYYELKFQLAKQTNEA